MMLVLIIDKKDIIYTLYRLIRYTTWTVEMVTFFYHMMIKLIGS